MIIVRKKHVTSVSINRIDKNTKKEMFPRLSDGLTNNGSFCLQSLSLPLIFSFLIILNHLILFSS